MQQSGADVVVYICRCELLVVEDDWSGKIDDNRSIEVDFGGGVRRLPPCVHFLVDGVCGGTSAQY